MSKEPSAPPPENDESPVAAAIRSKRQPNTSLLADLDALEAAIIADIEAFDMRAVTPVPEAPTAAELAAAQENTRNLFPEIVPEGAPRLLPAESAPAPHEPLAEPAAPTSLLQQLREEAQTRQQDAAARRQEMTATSRQLDAALRRIFAYCHDLVQQLNIVKPTVERQYSLLGTLEFSGLQWQEGFVDYRTRPHSAGAAYEQVSLTCNLAAPNKLSIERDGISAEKFRKTLFDNGVVFTCDEVRNSRRLLEKAVFSITAEVKINLRWCADLERGAIVLESRNFERFGSRSYTLAAEAVDLAMLDQFGRMLLGQPNRFRDFYSL